MPHARSALAAAALLLSSALLAFDPPSTLALAENSARTFAAGCWRASEAGAEPLPHAKVVLHVQDDGPGFDEAMRAHLFEPFFTTHPKGTGLGLYIARELAEANDATLALAPGASGADFILTANQQP